MDMVTFKGPINRQLSAVWENQAYSRSPTQWRESMQLFRETNLGGHRKEKPWLPPAQTDELAVLCRAAAIQTVISAPFYITGQQTEILAL